MWQLVKKAKVITCYPLNQVCKLRTLCSFFYLGVSFTGFFLLFLKISSKRVLKLAPLQDNFLLLLVEAKLGKSFVAYCRNYQHFKCIYSQTNSMHVSYGWSFRRPQQYTSKDKIKVWCIHEIEFYTVITNRLYTC